MNESYRQEIPDRLREQCLRYPAMQQQDAVKFIFQAMLGVGHLLADRDTVTKHLVRETDTLSADPDEPLLEPLSPAWCRLNLRRAMAEQLSSQIIAGLMMVSVFAPDFSRQDVYDLCVSLAQTGEMQLTDPRILEQITDPNWLPSHSPEYHEAYHPAYRVVSAGWVPYLEAVCRISRKLQEKRRIQVTIDGPCASGKTTLARRLAEVFQAAMVHTDDYVIPHAKKTEERLAVPGGNCDADRIVREILVPWSNEDPVRYRRYDCKADIFLPEEVLPESEILILEGSYSNLPGIREKADVRIFLDVSREVREMRLRKRESPESLKRFYERWIPLEEAYFAAFGLPDPDCILITGQ